MIVLNTVAHFYPQLDRPTKSGKSNRMKDSGRVRESAPSESGKSERRKSERSEGLTSEIPRYILNNSVVQNFIYTYVNEKLKTEKLNLQVDARFQKFLASLPTPIELNTIRSLKPEKNA